MTDEQLEKRGRAIAAKLRWTIEKTHTKNTVDFYRVIDDNNAVVGDNLNAGEMFSKLLNVVAEGS